MSAGAGRVYKRGKTWWLDYSHDGERYRESSKSHRKKDATALLKRRLAEIVDGRFAPDADRVTLEDVFELLVHDYKKNGRRSLGRARVSMNHLRAFFGKDCRVAGLTPTAVDRYTVDRMDGDDGVARGTVRRELAVLQRALNLAVKKNRLTVAPDIELPAEGEARKGFLDGDDLERVIAELPDYLRPVVLFGVMTGWRKREILSRTWAHVDFDAGIVRLDPGETKNGSGRVFPFAVLPRLADLLREQRDRTKALEKEQGRIIPHVFHRHGEPIKSMRTAWDGATRRAGCPDAIFHDLRRTAVRTLERAGVSRSVGMALTGHETADVYDRYAIVDEGALRDGVEKLATRTGGVWAATAAALGMTISELDAFADDATDHERDRLSELSDHIAQVRAWTADDGPVGWQVVPIDEQRRASQGHAG